MSTKTVKRATSRNDRPEAYGGHLGNARELTKRAVDSAIRADSKETGQFGRRMPLCNKQPMAMLHGPDSQRHRL
jgi:hypothetical protein